MGFNITLSLYLRKILILGQTCSYRPALIKQNVCTTFIVLTGVVKPKKLRLLSPREIVNVNSFTEFDKLAENKVLGMHLRIN